MYFLHSAVSWYGGARVHQHMLSNGIEPLTEVQPASQPWVSFDLLLICGFFFFSSCPHIAVLPRSKDSWIGGWIPSVYLTCENTQN